MNFPECPNTDLGVNLRGVQADMTEHGLDETNIGAVLQHQAYWLGSPKVVRLGCRKATERVQLECRKGAARG